MRIIIFALIALVIVALCLINAPAARAESPQPYQFALVQCSGLSIADVQRGQKLFDDQYGYDHQLQNYWQWVNTYTARANEYAASIGCPRVFDDSGNLTLHYKIFAPTFARILGDPMD